MSEIEKNLGTLADRINAEHRACEEAANSALVHAMNAGAMLTEAKASLPHGEFGPWLKENFAGSDRTARAYMRVYAHRGELEAKRQRSATLSLRGALKALEDAREAPAREREEAISELLEITVLSDTPPTLGQLARVHARIDALEEKVAPAMLAGWSPREFSGYKAHLPAEKLDTPIAQLRREGYSRLVFDANDFPVGGHVSGTPYTRRERRAYEAEEKLRCARREYRETVEGEGARVQPFVIQ